MLRRQISLGNTSSPNHQHFMIFFKKITRIGKRTFKGMLDDGKAAIVRYVKNNFYDGYNQVLFPFPLRLITVTSLKDCLDLALGRLNPVEVKYNKAVMNRFYLMLLIVRRWVLLSDSETSFRCWCYQSSSSWLLTLSMRICSARTSSAEHTNLRRTSSIILFWCSVS